MRFFLVLLTFIFTSFTFAQTSNKTRQGNWQQKTDYLISVRLDDVHHTLSAFEKIIYTNHSPDELNVLYFHLWPNAYKNSETPFANELLENGRSDFYFSDEESKGWIDSLDFKINGQKVKWYLLDSIDICKIELPTPLKPGKSITISTPFKVKIPAVFSRMGHENQLYCISQWYPKPAVYDINGWNYFPYLDQGEFYSEFGKFDVSITVPKNYIVAATGDLQNEEEKVWLKERTNLKFTKNNRTNTEKNDQSINSSNEFKTLRFVQDSVHDFAWFCDKRFMVEQSAVILKSGKKVNTSLYHIKPSENSVQWVDTAIAFYSRFLGEYPYNNASAVVTPLKAGGGMEYPTITNVESANSDIIVHEVGHNWFYGILANNERQYPWMDESLNTYYENRNAYLKQVPLHNGLRAGFKTTSKEASINAKLDETPFGILQLTYNLSARKNADQPINIPSTSFTDDNYGEIIYAKAPLLFHYLQDYLGDSLFDAMMQSYYEKWKFRHPLPDDFFDHVKSFTGKDLNWVNAFFSTTEKSDYKIVSAKNNQIIIKNKSSIAAPFPVSLMKNDSVLETKWFNGFNGKKTFSFNRSNGNKFRIDAYETTLDIYRNNNTIRTRGLFKKLEPVSFKLLGDLENPYKTQVFFSPIAGANLYNKTMAGLAFYNCIIPQKKFEYTLAPMYSFGTNDIVGYANFERHLSSDGVFNQIHLGVNGSRFAYNYYPNPFYIYPFTYNKISPFVKFDLNKKDKRSLIDQSLHLRSVFLFFNKNINNSDDPSNHTPSNNIRIDELSYNLENKKAINKNSFTATIQNINDNGNAIKIFSVFKQTVNYEKPKKKLDLRFFGGIFLSKTNSDQEFYEFKTIGNTGTVDYLFDHALIGRSETNGMFSQQLIEKDGNIHLPITNSNSHTNSWIVSSNLVTTIPGPIPIRLFADIVYFNSLSTLNSQIFYTPTFQYVAGVKLVIVEDIFEINVPLFNSQYFEDFYQSISPNYKDENSFQHLARKITFTLNLNKMNPIKAVKNISF